MPLAKIHDVELKRNTTDIKSLGSAMSTSIQPIGVSSTAIHELVDTEDKIDEGPFSSELKEIVHLIGEITSRIEKYTNSNDHYFKMNLLPRALSIHAHIEKTNELLDKIITIHGSHGSTAKTILTNAVTVLTKEIEKIKMKIKYLDYLEPRPIIKPIQNMTIGLSSIIQKFIDRPTKIQDIGTKTPGGIHTLAENKFTDDNNFSEIDAQIDILQFLPPRPPTPPPTTNKYYFRQNGGNPDDKEQTIAELRELVAQLKKSVAELSNSSTQKPSTNIPYTNKYQNLCESLNKIKL